MTAAPLRVLLNASAVPLRPAGAGVYTLQLAKALACRDDIELVVASAHEAPPGERAISSPPGRFAAAAWEQLRLAGVLRREGVDVYHGAHFAVPLFAAVPRVATVHDLTFYRIPARYRMRHRLYYRLLAWTVKSADRVIVPSSTVAADAVRYLGYPPERIRVIHEAARAGLRPASIENVATLRAKLGLQRPYLLCVGTAEPGKRAIDAVRALVQLKERGVDTALVLAGNPGRLSGALEREVGRLGLSGDVVFAGYVPDADLAALYTGATALVFPSLYEGFGLPPLEAMACGTPVIASRAPVMTEILEGAASFVALGDHQAIATEAARLLENEACRSEWSARGLERAASFSWERAAAETVDVYREVVR